MTDEMNVKNKKWLTAKKLKWIIICVIIIAVAAGFAHQYYLRTDSHIKSLFEKNETQLEQVAQFFHTKNPVDSAIKHASDNDYTAPDNNNVSIGILQSDETNAEIADVLAILEDDCDINSISAKNGIVTFTTTYSCKYIFTESGKSPSDLSTKINDNWYYIVTAQ